MTTRRKVPSKSFRANELFEEHVTSTLEAQDRMLERLEEKLERPVLNGGFDSLVAKVDKIESVSEQLRANLVDSSKKIDAIHVAVYDPDTGLYQKVKNNVRWIENANKGLKWFLGMMLAGLLTGLGKLAYDFVMGHIRFMP